MKKLLLSVLIASFVSITAMAAEPLELTPMDKYHSIILSDDLTVYNEEGAEIGVLHSGDEISLKNYNFNMLEIRLPDGGSGYVEIGSICGEFKLPQIRKSFDKIETFDVLLGDSAVLHLDTEWELDTSYDILTYSINDEAMLMIYLLDGIEEDASETIKDLYMTMATASLSQDSTNNHVDDYYFEINGHLAKYDAFTNRSTFLKTVVISVDTGSNIAVLNYVSSAFGMTGFDHFQASVMNIDFK